MWRHLGKPAGAWRPGSCAVTLRLCDATAPSCGREEASQTGTEHGLPGEGKLACGHSPGLLHSESARG